MIYLDHAASTPMRPEAVAAMLPYLTEHAGNPSGSHAASRIAKSALEQAREDVAACLGCDAREVIFTGGGSEADNLAIKGAAWARHDEGLDGVVTTQIEHKAVLGATHRLAKEGFRVEHARATSDGIVDLDELSSYLDERTSLVSVMTVNNETGIVQPLGELYELVRAQSPHALIHTDAVQAPQWLDMTVATAGCDLVSISGHKFGGPKGVGVLVNRSRTDLVPLIEGGGHELGFRAGTQNVAGIVALGAALMATHEHRSEETIRIAGMRDELQSGLLRQLNNIALNGDIERRVAGFLHVAIAGVESETLLVALDVLGVCAASGSACSSGAIDPSHVLLAMGMSRERALSSVRFSLGWASTQPEMEQAMLGVADAVTRLRAVAA